MNRFIRYMGQKCDECGFCRYARENPATLAGRIMAWHGRWCPAWKARKLIEEERLQERREGPPDDRGPGARGGI